MNYRVMYSSVAWVPAIVVGFLTIYIGCNQFWQFIFSILFDPVSRDGQISFVENITGIVVYFAIAVLGGLVTAVLARRREILCAFVAGFSFSSYTHYAIGLSGVPFLTIPEVPIGAIVGAFIYLRFFKSAHQIETSILAEHRITASAMITILGTITIALSNFMPAILGATDPSGIGQAITVLFFLALGLLILGCVVGYAIFAWGKLNKPTGSILLASIVIAIVVVLGMDL